MMRHSPEGRNTKIQWGSDEILHDTPNFLNENAQLSIWTNSTFSFIGYSINIKLFSRVICLKYLRFLPYYNASVSDLHLFWVLSRLWGFSGYVDGGAAGQYKTII